MGDVNHAVCAVEINAGMWDQLCQYSEGKPAKEFHAVATVQTYFHDPQ